MPTPITLTLDDSDLAALDRYIAQQGSARSHEEALAELVRLALGQLASEASSDEGLRPDQLNASDDS